MENRKTITIEADVNAPVEKVWACWTQPEHIMQWNSASDDWHTPHAENDLRVGGKFASRMEAKDGSVGFDFAGVYDEIKKHERIAYTIDDGRKVSVVFSGNGNQTRITEAFEAENEHSPEMQKSGWQAILDNFKKYVEAGRKGGFQQLHFSISINAPKEKVWHTMLDNETYVQWTSAFAEGSYFKGSWEQGRKILFLGPEGSGMVAKIVESRPYDFVSIEHTGFVSNGVEDTESPAAKAFAGAHENYTFLEKDGKTEVLVDMDTGEEYKAMFEEMWPEALLKLKSLAEA